MNIGLYTINDNAVGGGGRRVFRGLLHNWSCLGHNVYVISRSKDLFNFGKNIKHIPLQESSINLELDYLVCDTEYALLDLFSNQYGDMFAKNVVLCTFVHDQIWRDHMEITKKILGCFSRNPNYLFCRNISYLYKKRIIYYLTNPESLKEFFCNLLKLIIPYKVLNIKHILSAQKRFNLQYVFINKCKHVFSLTNKAALETAKMYGIDYNRSNHAFGFIDDELSSLNQSINEITKDSKFFVAFSRLSPEKNIDFIIDAFISAQKSNPDIFLTIIGRNDSTKTARHCRYLKDLVNKNTSSNISMVTNPSQEVLSKTLGKASTIICANNTDFNLTILEFLYLGGRAILPATYDFEESISKHPNISLKNLCLNDYTREILKFADMPITIDYNLINRLNKYTYENYSMKVLDTLIKNFK